MALCGEQQLIVNVKVFTGIVILLQIGHDRK